MRNSLSLALLFLLTLGCEATLPNFESVYDKAEALTNLRVVEGIKSESELIPLVDAFEAELATAKGKATSDRENAFVREAESLLGIYKDGLLVSTQNTEISVDGQEIPVIPATQETKAIFSKYGATPKVANGTEYFDATSTDKLWRAALEQWGKLQSVYKSRGR